MNEMEHVIVDQKGEIVYRSDTLRDASLWCDSFEPDGGNYTIEPMDKPSEPKMTDAEVAGMFIDAARDLSKRRILAPEHSGLDTPERVGECLALWDSMKSKREPEPRQAHEIAEAALQHVKDRASTYDQINGERSARQTATAFNAITGENLTESDVWLLLQLLKDVRQWSKEDYHQDSAEDCIAYAALKAESLEREHKNKP